MPRRPATPEPPTDKVKLEYLAADPKSLQAGGKDVLQGVDFHPMEPLLDGPVSRRVAVVDLDPVTGEVVPGARFVPPKGKSHGYYEVKDETDVDAADFQQVSVFGAIVKMMSLFETPDVLGRELRWAFEGEQLLVVPRAGQMANAFYHRDTRSLQFFFIPDPNDATRKIFTCLSPDIVAHETTHAILDGIAPDLYNGTSPQCLALHEAIADLGAVLLATRTKRLQYEVLKATGGDLRKARAFNDIAKQFGEALYGEGRPLRDLSQRVTFAEPNGRDLREPHDLSLVLSSALYALLIDEYDAKLKNAIAEHPEKTAFSLSGGTLFAATAAFKRIIFRALDYLPPGEISFADYGRALIAADGQTNPEDPRPRDTLKQIFVDWGIVESADQLDPIPPGFDLSAGLDLDQLVHSDWAAYRFAEVHREKLLIPPGVAFEVRPRLDVVRTTWRKGGVEATTRTVLFKVGWQTAQKADETEDYREIAVMRGTTIAIDRETRRIEVLLSTSPDHPSQTAAATAADADQRRRYVAKLFEDGVLERSSANVQVQDGMLRLRATGQLLHMMRDHDD